MNKRLKSFHKIKLIAKFTRLGSKRRKSVISDLKPVRMKSKRKKSMLYYLGVNLIAIIGFIEKSKRKPSANKKSKINLDVSICTMPLS